ncbi:NAD-dependent epimerase/dehydratase family protein, partial [Actinosynnema sp.]|uniref:NAD-dependent epimerase/dehydratase family protein n=1 Tax=Actinosynnema sp. TaxID=1872144 RepID=UPI003F845522
MGSAGKVVLVTGVSRDLGRRFARSIATDPTVDRVIGVDVVPPRGDIGDVSFVRADIRNPVIAKVIAKEDVDTVVHMSVISTPGSAGGRNTMKELNVIGTMQLLAACQKAPGLRALVVKSSTAVYGASPRDPAMFTEDMEPRRAPRSGYAKDVNEIEGYVRGVARRRPDVRVTTLRCANVIGPHVVSPMTSYFRLPVIPTVLGYDARMQFLHEQDLMDVLLHAVRHDVPGTFNVAG